VFLETLITSWLQWITTELWNSWKNINSTLVPCFEDPIYYCVLK
jgi:hypothetical protein